ncbi:PRE4 [Cyberlindnera jadinii]|uniref:Proteasome subunit beta n=1 Tax=Cyberlindnera jadinii (strain ATCC 18201 / CBS 1600 / BCRC 20928 / JCM 3617 / NBRC 0987 / NRRL Y-1542) TaxID=983966 RepID=A0A0H5C6H9_CYBJN|nr:proteasome endopeptidase complex, beta subunit [Cyberlindnera jadinii NRRL Y-1542]ODV73674.1 proteasome endopeptidase complex, beta subunit [Cyberlindnera jadinii NRRL Y-1542]CEP23467.1 PRE4 [Cyberlindnera jadinii]
MDHDPFRWGRPSDATYGAYNTAIANASAHGSSANSSEYPKMNTQQPIVTGTSVIAMKFRDGIIIAADNLGSYGSLARFTEVERLFPVGENAVVGVSGDISDLQEVGRLLEQLETETSYDYDGHSLRAPHIHEYLQKVFYARRSKMDPLWNSVVVGGLEDGKPFLKYVDLLGVTYSSPTIATGFGAHLAIPLLRKVVFKEEDVESIDEATARKAIEECMKVLYYRDARSLDKYSLITITKEKGVVFEKNLKSENQSWRFAKDIKGYGTQVV